ncbi:6-phosphogluconate dehydrogenase [Lyngbya sp. PCC 8106]|nr:6-phosphogluconate dehydrogenase [Lyngbya sp. PCC 8106]
MEILLLVLGVIACILLLPLLFPVAIAAVAIGFLYLLMTKGIILLFNALG